MLWYYDIQFHLKTIRFLHNPELHCSAIGKTMRITHNSTHWIAQKKKNIHMTLNSHAMLSFDDLKFRENMSKYQIGLLVIC